MNARATQRAFAVLAAVAALAMGAGPAAAQARDTITIGLFAPTAPFEGTGDRLGYINALADHLSSVAGGRKVVGKVYGSAGAFAGAVKKGELQFAVIDAPYAAALGLPYQVLASATRDGSSVAPWQLVSGGSVNRLNDLRGKKVVVPTIGAKANAFVTNALLGAEVEASYFEKVLEAADARSALTMVSVGKADAAMVPSGVDLPGGLRQVMTLPSVGWPMFVALPGSDGPMSQAFAVRVKSFSSGGVFGGFTSGDAGRYRSLAGSFGKSTKKGPMAVPPPARLTVRELLEGRTFAIPLSDVLALVEAPGGK